MRWFIISILKWKQFGVLSWGNDSMIIRINWKKSIRLPNICLFLLLNKRSAIILICLKSTFHLAKTGIKFSYLFWNTKLKSNSIRNDTTPCQKLVFDYLLRNSTIANVNIKSVINKIISSGYKQSQKFHFLIYANTNQIKSLHFDWRENW